MRYKLNSTIVSPLKNLPGLLFTEEKNGETIIEVQEYQSVVDQNITVSGLPKNSNSTLVHHCLNKLAETKFPKEDAAVSTVKHLREYLLHAAAIDGRQHNSHNKPSIWIKVTARRWFSMVFSMDAGYVLCSSRSAS